MSSLEQLASQISKGFNPLEPRDIRGRWTKDEAHNKLTGHAKQVKVLENRISRSKTILADKGQSFAVKRDVQQGLERDTAKMNEHLAHAKAIFDAYPELANKANFRHLRSVK